MQGKGLAFCDRCILSGINSQIRMDPKGNGILAHTSVWFCCRQDIGDGIEHGGNRVGNGRVTQSIFRPPVE